MSARDSTSGARRRTSVEHRRPWTARPGGGSGVGGSNHRNSTARREKLDEGTPDPGRISFTEEEVEQLARQDLQRRMKMLSVEMQREGKIEQLQSLPDFGGRWQRGGSSGARIHIK